MIEIIGPLANPAAGSVEKSVPLQKQLIERLQQAILAGRLPAGRCCRRRVCWLRRWACRAIPW